MAVKGHFLCYPHGNRVEAGYFMNFSLIKGKLFVFDRFDKWEILCYNMCTKIKEWEKVDKSVDYWG